MNFTKETLIALAAVTIRLTTVTAARLNTQIIVPSDGTIRPTPAPTNTSPPQQVSSINVDIYTHARGHNKTN